MLNVKIITLCAVILGCLLNATNCFAALNENTRWNYQGKQGPQHWGELDARYKLCTVGKKQSPIDITYAVPTDKSLIKINYAPIVVQAAYATASPLVINHKKIILNDGHTLQINSPQNTDSEYIMADGVKYRLIQFHFHTPGENFIKGKQFPIEIHFVNQSENGKLAVLAVMLQQGKYNRALQDFLNELPNSKKALKIANKLFVNVNDFIPANTSYYAFTGSLTTPPCYEGVQWFVFATPLEASPLQIDHLKLLLPANNARPIQEINGREIMQGMA